MGFYSKGDSRTVCKPKAANCPHSACVVENDAINEHAEMTDDLDVVNRERDTFIVMHVLFHCGIYSPYSINASAFSNAQTKILQKIASCEEYILYKETTMY